jgi:hypothetical protein
MVVGYAYDISFSGHPWRLANGKYLFMMNAFALLNLIVIDTLGNSR